MLLFGHLGLTLAAAASVDLIGSRIQAGNKPGVGKQTRERFRFFGRADIRLVLLGSLLPDIIDKPLGIYLLPDFFSSGRIISHTLLFLIATILGGIILKWRTGRLWLLVMALGVFTHFVFDAEWVDPSTLFWPFLGATFPPIQTENWLARIFKVMTTVNVNSVCEVAGFAVMAAWGIWLVKSKQVGAFIKTGRTRLFSG